jgi:hypothetical protein
VAAAIVVGISAVAIGVVMAQAHPQAQSPSHSPAARATATPLPQQVAPPSSAPSVRLLSTYHMRCWQEGQLVLEEALTQAPADNAAQSTRLQGSQAAGTAVMLINAGTATCLIKPAR